MDQRLKATPGIYLTGFMGCGKSTVGRLLASKLCWSFVDLDQEIEQAEGRRIAEIFEAEGEERFRAIEATALKEQIRLVRGGRARVVALGGGAFVQPDNRERLLSDGGLVVFLDVPVETLWRRIASEEHRPLASDPERFRALYAARLPLYGQAHQTIDADRDPETIVDEIFRLSLT
ncbi:MAG: AAA family ATPase [Acidobacteria bacterium]|nr:AAA family ATPase [Acidobacteriota bacterium]